MPPELADFDRGYPGRLLVGIVWSFHQPEVVDVALVVALYGEPAAFVLVLISRRGDLVEVLSGGQVGLIVAVLDGRYGGNHRARLVLQFDRGPADIAHDFAALIQGVNSTVRSRALS